MRTGVREKQIAFLKVKVYAIGVYAQSDVVASLASWKGKAAADLIKDESLFQGLAQGWLVVPYASISPFLK